MYGCAKYGVVARLWAASRAWPASRRISLRFRMARVFMKWKSKGNGDSDHDLLMTFDNDHDGDTKRDPKPITIMRAVANS